MDANSLVYLFVQFASCLDVMRRKPATNVLALQVGKQAVGEFLVFAGIADEAGVKLQRLPDQRTHEVDEVVGNAGATQKAHRNLSLGTVDRINADCRRSFMLYGFDSLDRAQIDIRKYGADYQSLGEISPFEICPR